MPFITGQANSMQGLSDALTTAIAANGWTSQGNGFWTKDGCAVRLDVANINFYSTTQMSLRVASGASVSGGAFVRPAPGGQCIGDMQPPNSSDGRLTFPATYAIHINENPDEVYFFVNSDVVFWQWLAFGKSDVPGLLGTGNWTGGTLGCPSTGKQGYESGWLPTISSDELGNQTGRLTSGILFWQNANTWFACVSTIHDELDDDGWNYLPLGGRGAYPRLSYGLGDWNQSAPLIPIRAFRDLPDSKCCLVAELAHARYLRIDNYNAGDIITLGQDKWRVYPWYRKHSSVLWSSGNYGVALRYDGA